MSDRKQNPFYSAVSGSTLLQKICQTKTKIAKNATGSSDRIFSNRANLILKLCFCQYILLAWFSKLTFDVLLLAVAVTEASITILLESVVLRTCHRIIWICLIFLGPLSWSCRCPDFRIYRINLVVVVLKVLWSTWSTRVPAVQVRISELHGVF